MTDAVQPDEEHSAWGGSVLHRRLKCPGSAPLEAPFPNRSSAAAEEGTMLHDVVARSILNGFSMVEDVKLTDEQVDAVEYCLDAARKFHGDMQAIGASVERKFRLDFGQKLYGTADFLLYRQNPSEVVVMDWKFGRGVKVEAEYDGAVNPQLGFYAMGAVAELATSVPRPRVTVVVVQPRLKATLIRPVARIELDELRDDILEAQRLAEQPDPPLAVGDHCTFCKARHVCPAYRSQYDDVAALRYEPIPTEASQIASLLDQFPHVEGFIKAVRDRAHELAGTGSLPGWKLVAKAARRKWSMEPGEVIQRLMSRGVPEAKAYTQDPITPAQAEAILKKLKLPFDFSDMTTAESAGTNLVPESNSKPAALRPTADEEFA